MICHLMLMMFFAKLSRIKNWTPLCFITPGEFEKENEDEELLIFEDIFKLLLKLEVISVSQIVNDVISMAIC